MEIGRLMSLLELIESFLRLVSSYPMESGNLMSLLKFALSSSSDLIQQQTVNHLNTCFNVLVRGL